MRINSIIYQPMNHGDPEYDLDTDTVIPIIICKKNRLNVITSVDASV